MSLNKLLDDDKGSRHEVDQFPSAIRRVNGIKKHKRCQQTNFGRRYDSSRMRIIVARVSKLIQEFNAAVVQVLLFPSIAPFAKFIVIKSLNILEHIKDGSPAV